MRVTGGAAALVLALALSGCGSTDEEPAAASSSSVGAAPASGSATAEATEATGAAGASGSPSAEPTTYLPVPAGVTLTDQGSALGVGAPATVAWQPRQDVTGVLDVTVTGLQRTTLNRSFSGWQIPEQTRSARPFFVRATLTNRGESDLSGRAVPLYAVDAAGTLIESTSFASVFRPCRQGVLPDAFTPGATTEVCLVFFVPDGGELTGVSFRPTQDFDPITWTGAIAMVAKKRS